MVAPRAGRALLGVGVVAMVFGLSLMGIAALGSGSSPSASNARLATAATAACTATVSLVDTPAALVVGHPMTGVVNYAFSGPSAHACATGAHVLVTGLPAGCPNSGSQTFTCTPQVAGTFHVQTTVFAQNTATTIVDTVVVR
jgi:hypothetical protein